MLRPDRRRPPLIAAAPAFDPTNLSYFSSGVLVMNLPRLRRVQERFRATIQARLRGEFRHLAHHQESFNRLFRAKALNRLR